MSTRPFALRTGALLAAVVTLALLSVALSGETPAPAPAAKPARADGEKPGVDEARRQARLLHATIHATLQHVHHRLYREDEGLPLPARVLRDVFADVEKEQPVQFRWLAVEGQAMRAAHKASTPFEERAAKALAAGQAEFEEVEDGAYRRAGAITLTNECLKCHVPDRKTTEDRMAGLIITIPVRK